MEVHGKHGKTRKADASAVTTTHPMGEQQIFQSCLIPCPFGFSVDIPSPFLGLARGNSGRPPRCARFVALLRGGNLAHKARIQCRVQSGVPLRQGMNPAQCQRLARKGEALFLLFPALSPRLWRSLPAPCDIVKVPTLYLDTSVIGGYHDPEWMQDTREVWRQR